MPVKNIQFSFSGGVFAPSLFGRPDLEKYSLGLRDALNYFVDYRGGVMSRPGFEFLSENISTSTNTVLKRFRFNNKLANTYLMVFTAGAVRFMQDGGFLVEADKTATAITAGLVASVAHGYLNGDLINFPQGVFTVSDRTANTFKLKDAAGTYATFSAGSTIMARIYTVATPYAAADLQDLCFRQRRNEIIITHVDYAPATLTRFGHTNWTYAAIAFGDTPLASPTNQVAAASGAGAASLNFTVTAVDSAGVESIVSTITQKDGIVNYTTTAGHITFNWDTVIGAHHYNVYRSTVFPTAAANSPGQALGFIGQTLNTQFTDNNIIPDFTRNPPLKFNPFAPGPIVVCDVTAGGTGYTSATVSITDPDGTDFAGIPLITNGAITGVMIINPGEGYTAPVLSFAGTGTGATGTATAGELSGTYPASSVLYAQRLWMLGSTAFPLRLAASQISDAAFSYNQGIYAAPTDPIFLDIDSGELTPIRYGELVNDSLFVFTGQSIWQIALQDGAYKASLRTENGIGQVPPLLVNRDILFSLAEGTGVWALRPSNLPNYYVDVDLSTFAGHLFTPDDPIVSWAFAREPYRIIWACTARGNLLSLTYISEQNVYAWMPHNTQGKILSVESLNENGVDRLYAAVEREGRVYLERMSLRNYKTPEDIFAVDSGLRTVLNYPAATLTVSDITEDSAICTTSVSVFSPTDIGAHVRAGGGRGEIISYTSATQVTVSFDMPISARKPQSDDYPNFPAGEWSLNQRTAVVSGLYHLEGRTVEIFADGSDFGTAVVTNGAVALDQSASYVTVGLAYTGFVETLPLTTDSAVIEDRVKRISAIAIRLENTRGLWYGLPPAIYQMKERTTEKLRAPTRFQSGIHTLTTRSNWRIDTPVRFEKRGPTASTILNIILSVELGDDEE